MGAGAPVSIISNQGDEIGLEAVGQPNRFPDEVEADQGSVVQIGQDCDLLPHEGFRKVRNGNGLPDNANLRSFPESVGGGGGRQAGQRTADLQNSPNEGTSCDHSQVS